jgi:hypothetical protein
MLTDLFGLPFQFGFSQEGGEHMFALEGDFPLCFHKIENNEILIFWENVCHSK